MARVMAPAMARAMAEGIGTRGSQAKPLPLSMVQVVCGVSNNGCIASNGDLDAVAEVTHDPRGLSDVSSCNATNSIEHLDYDHQPPCEADYDPPHPIGEAAATWILRVSSECGHQLFSFGLFCWDCKACYDRAGRRWECLTCSGEFRLSWDPLR